MQPTYDTLQRFLFDQTSVRGGIVRLQASYQAVSKRQTYPTLVKNLLGEALAAATLLSTTLKFAGTLILQIQNDGPLEALVAHCDNHLHIRGMARWQQDFTAIDFHSACQHGQLALTLLPEHGNRYQGVVALTQADSLATAITDYFTQSEQLPTSLFLAANGQTAAGLYLQQLPLKEGVIVNEHHWEHLNHLAKTLTVDELLNLPNETLLRRLYHEEDVLVFEHEPVSFRCTCSEDKCAATLRLLDRADADELLQNDKKISVTCQFCNRQYDFDAVDVERIYASHAVSAAPHLAQ